MNIRIEMLRNPDYCRDALAKDGWKLVVKKELDFNASHPSVRDEEEARVRLCRLGLLTSSSLRIEFARKG